MTLRAPLSPRQREILALVASGLEDTQIAERMGTTVATTRRHVVDLRYKLGARSRAHAVAIAYRTGQLTIDTREAS